MYPQQLEKARACRAFLARAVRHLVREAGVRQFLDVGSGLPTADNTHEVAQRLAPDARVVYVDNDPLVLEHARALLTSTPEGATAYLDADMRDPEALLARAAATLHPTRPTALILLGVLGHVADDGEARSIVRRLLAGLAPGSFLVESDGTDTSDAYLAAIEQYADSGGDAYHVRTPDRIAAFYTGLDLVDPGVTPIHLWRPDGSPGPDVDEYGGVGRTPGT